MVKITTLRMRLSLIAKKDLQLISPIGIKIVYLFGHLNEEINVEQFDGYEVIGEVHLVCKLKKILYGLKQSPIVVPKV